MVDYICYISRSKVDQLYSQVDPLDAGEVTQTATTTKTLAASGGAATPTLLSLLKASLSYGRSDVVQTERKAKRQYSDKLRKLIEHLDGRNEILLFDQLLSTSSSPSNYFSYTGDFRVASPLAESAPSHQVVTIESASARGKLLLDCSLRNFSDGNTAGGSFQVHSGNASFFSGRIALRFETVAIFLSHEKNLVYATPLYLVLRFPAQDPGDGHQTLVL